MVGPQLFVLEELKHDGRQRLGDAVDLVQEQDALLCSALFHQIIDRGDNFRHGVFRDGGLFSAIAPLLNDRQAKRALSRVVRHGIADQSDAELAGHLLYNGGFPDAGRAHQEDRALFLRGNAVVAECVFLKVDPKGIANLFFCLRDIHRANSSSRLTVSVGSAASRRSAVSSGFPISSARVR